MLPGVAGVADTREAAIRAVEQAIRDAVKDAEVVEVNLPELEAPEENVWLTTAGIFADDPTLEPMLREIYAAREASRDAE